MVFPMTRSALIFLAVISIFSLACGWFDDELTDITYREDVSVSFPINADILCPPGVDCTETSTTAANDVELMEIEFDVKIDVVEAMGNDKLQDVASRLRTIEITSIDYEIRDNSLNFDLPDLKIYLGSKDAKKHTDAGVMELTTIPATAAGKNASGNAPVVEANKAAISDQLKTLQFVAIPFAKPVVKRGKPFPPTGKADLKLTLNLKLVANPLDAF